VRSSVGLEGTGVSEDCVASIFKVEYANEEGLFLRNVGSYYTYTAHHPRSRHYSTPEVENIPKRRPLAENVWLT
jgi:hypothetical protein